MKDDRALDHEFITSNILANVWPDNRLIPLPEPFVNDAGIIQNLMLHPITSVAIIISNSDTIRANHYHMSDWHYSYIVSGRIVYFEREVGNQIIPKPLTYTSGQMFFTPPMMEHAMYFPCQTTFVTLAKNVRSHENHEADLVRVEFMTKELAARIS